MDSRPTTPPSQIASPANPFPPAADQIPATAPQPPLSAALSTDDSDSESKILKSEIETREHCLYCGEPLPPLLPDGQRPSPWCQGCNSPIAADPGFAIREVCPTCRAALPLHGYTAKRHSNICPECRNRLPDLDPAAPIKWLPPQHKLQAAGRVKSL